MELRHYWYIVRRRWWLPLGLVALVALFSLVGQRPWEAQPTVFTATLRFNVGLRPEPPTADYYTYDRYYTWLGAEYLIDDLSEIVKGSAFAEAVTARLAGSGLTLAPGAVQGSTQAGKLHRILTVTTSWGDPTDLAAITQAVSETIQFDLPRFYGDLLTTTPGGAPIEAVLIDGPHVGANAPGLRERLDLPLRLILALLLGIGLVFLADYLDPHVRGRAELEAMGLPVIGEIPRG